MKTYNLELDCTQIYTGQSVIVEIDAESEDGAREQIKEGFDDPRDGAELRHIEIVSIKEAIAK